MDIQQLGPYRIVGSLGRGGMGVVYEGVHCETGGHAAVKVLQPELASNPNFRERFAAEIESLKQLRHPNIVQLFGHGVEGEWLFYVMELVGGSSVEARLRAGHAYSWREAAGAAIQVCAALRHAHDRGVIHRDLKPANLLLTEQGQVKLADFGIARLFGGAPLTAAGGVIGTADYMAPEQTEGAAVDARCDIYSLGAVIYAMLTRRPPLVGANMAEVIHKLQHVEPEPLSHVVEDVPHELEAIVAKLLEKAPADRIATATALSRRLESLLASDDGDRPTQVSRGGREPHELPADPAHQTGDSGKDTAPIGEGSPGGEGGASHNLSDIPEAHEAGESRDSPPEEAADDADRTRIEPPAASTAGSPALPTAFEASSATAAEQRSGAPESQEPASDEPQPRRFTTLAEDRPARRRDATPAPGERVAKLAKVALPLALLAVLVGLVWYWLQPPSADQLYSRLSQADLGENLSPAATDALAEAAESFLSRFPEDPRGDEVRDIQQELLLRQRSRRLLLRAKFRRGDKQLSPLERHYVEALRAADANPIAAASRLEDLLVLAGDPAAGQQRERHVIELARRLLEDLKPRAEARKAAGRKLITDRLADAQRLAAHDPATARAIYQSIVRLYGEAPWAADLVEAAQTQLAAP